MSNHLRPVENLSWDVVVVGAGSAGCAAAIAAARRGRRVLLLEAGNAPGGVSTVGGISEWYAHLDGLGDIFDSVTREMKAYGMSHECDGRYFFNSEYLKLIWQWALEQAGVHCLFHATLSGCEVRAGRVQTVEVISCGQRLSFSAEYFVDCSGEGVLGFLAGAPFMKGDPESGRTLHMSLSCQLIDTGREMTHYLPAGIEPILSSDDLPGLNVAIPMSDGRVYCNMTKIMGEDPTDPQSLSRAESRARIQLAQVVHYLNRTQFPRHALVSSAAKIGIREGRRLLGDYVLTESDITSPSGCDFPDGVAVATCAIDFHSLSEKGHGGRREKVQPYAIPFRCLRVRGFANLLMAGKCISGDQVAHSSYRMTPTCCAMGQAVGTAAALAVENGWDDIRLLPVKDLQAQLTRDGMELDACRHRAFAPEADAPQNSSPA
jgi:hypothetical protein